MCLNILKSPFLDFVFPVPKCKQKAPKDVFQELMYIEYKKHIIWPLIASQNSNLSLNIETKRIKPTSLLNLYNPCVYKSFLKFV